jgi:protein O-mannosyl-transferase
VIVAAGLLTYWNSLGAPFVWDDETSIVRNATIQRLWPLWQPLLPPRETPVAGRPIVNLLFAVNYAIGGLSETGYHVGNLVLHIACALLLFGLVRRTLLGRRLRARFADSATGMALMAALIWMLHPIQSEVVDYVTQRTESTMALFFLLTLYCALRARDEGGFWQILSVTACALGMASKESMVTAPLIVWLYDGVFEFDSWGEAWKARKFLYGGLAATWIVLGLLLWQQPRSTAGLATPVSSWMYLLNQVGMLGRYLWLMVWPSTLILDYGLPRALSARDVFPAALVVVPLVIASGVALWRWPRIGFLAAAFFLILAPTSSVIPISSEVGAERRVYLSFAAIAILAVLAGRAVLDRAGGDPSKRARSRILAAGVAVVVIALLAGRTVARNADYASGVSLWRTVVERRPHGRARAALANELITAGQHDEAVRLLRDAVADYPDARFALGTELIVDGKIDEGIAELRTFIGDKPANLNRIPARTLIGQALASQGRWPEAIDQFRALLKIAPSYDRVRDSLADALAAQGRDEEAMTEYRSLLANQPNNGTIETKMAANLMRAGRTAEAIEHFQNALRLEPQSPALNRALAEAYLRQQDPDRADPFAREAVRLAPGDAASHNLLAIALASRGRVDEAVKSFREALRLNPDNKEAQANLERILRISASRPQGAPRQTR